MARSRNIKPQFFTNEDLVELPFEARLLFIGLWTEADRLGRLGDRPKRLKMALFPADNIDIDLQLNSLAKAGFILRYEANSERFIQVLNFDKHQSPHVKEVASTIPAPTEHEQKPVQEQQDTGEHGSSTVQAPDNTDAEPVLAALIPDSLSLDSLIPDSPSTDSQPQAAKSGKPARNPPSKRNDQIIADLMSLGVSEQHATDWLTVRKSKKATVLTETALKGLVAESGKAGLTVDQAVVTCVERNWTSLRADWLENKSGANHAINQKPRLTSFERVLAANAEAAYGNDFTGFDDSNAIDCDEYAKIG